MDGNEKLSTDGATTSLLGKREDGASNISCPVQLMARARELGFSPKELLALKRLYGKTNVLKSGK